MAVSPYARDEELFVRCRSCGWPVASGVRRRAGALARAAPGPREHRCPRCGAAHVYGPDEYGYLEDLAGPPASGGPGAEERERGAG